MSQHPIAASSLGWRGLSYGSVGLALVASGLLVYLLARCAGPRPAPAPDPIARGERERERVLSPEKESVVVTHRPTRAPFSLESEPEVRVSLASVRGATKVRLSTTGPCEVAVGDAAPVKRTRLDRYDVVSNQKGLRAPGVRNDVASIRFRADGGVTIDGKSYRGDLVLTRIDGGRIEAVNVLTMEDYLRGVVSGEMPRTFPAAALEAQAIVARTYALATVSGLRSGSTLILADDVSDQVYRGRSAETSETDAAVARTKGLVVVHDGNPIVAYFHSTCGGHTSDPAPVLKRPTSPPLRGVECGFCADSPHYRWTVELTRDDARRALVACGLGAPAVAAFSLVPGTTDDGGRLLEFRATSGSDGGVSGVDANAFRLAVGSRTLKATRVDSIESRGGSLRFTGGGFGHGCGLCQYGSRGLAMAGRDSLGILSHYFPDSSVARVYPVNGADATAQR